MGAPDTSRLFADLAVADSSRYSTRSRLMLTGLSFAIGILTTLLYLAVSYACSRRRRQRGAGAGAGTEDQEAGMSDADIVCEQADVAQAAPMDMDCAVCLGQVEAGEKLRRLPACAHLFHADCLHAWLRAHSTCPMCRAATTPAATAAAEGAATWRGCRHAACLGTDELNHTDRRIARVMDRLATLTGE